MSEVIEKEASSIALHTENDQNASSLLEQIVIHTQLLKPSTDEYERFIKGVETLSQNISLGDLEKVDNLLIDQIIAKEEKVIGYQVDQIVHHRKFQELESAWRGLKFLIDRAEATGYGEQIKIAMLNVTKEELSEDFEDCSPDLKKSWLYKQVYETGYGMLGGEPVGAILGNYYFGHEHCDINLLTDISSISAKAHAPFISSVKPELLGVDKYTDFAEIKDLNAVFSDPKFTRFQSFRESEHARYIGLIPTRFLLRLPYHPDTNPIKGFNYTEDVSDHSSYLWGNPVYAHGAIQAESFAKAGWCSKLIGPKEGGKVSNLPIHTYEALGESVIKPPIEMALSFSKEFELDKNGFMSMVWEKGSNEAVFFSNTSCQKHLYFGQGEEAEKKERDFKLGTKLSNVFVISRLAHYLKVMHIQKIGADLEITELENDLNAWLRQYVAAGETVDKYIAIKCPFKEAKVVVKEVKNEPGFYKIEVNIVPRNEAFKFDVNLKLVGDLENSNSDM